MKKNMQVRIGRASKMTEYIDKRGWRFEVMDNRRGA